MKFSFRSTALSALALFLLSALSVNVFAVGGNNYFENLRDKKKLFRLESGFASDADFGPSLLFITDQSQENTFYSGVAVGLQLGDSLFGYPVDVVGFFAVQNFHERGFQADALGVTLFWKVYKKWNFRWLPDNLPIRIGLGQGLSYASRIPVAEQRDFQPEDSAETVHFLEWSVQLPVKALLSPFSDYFTVGDDIWLGYNIFHRSTVFGLFADGPGGVNYPGIALEFVFD